MLKFFSPNKLRKGAFIILRRENLLLVLIRESVSEQSPSGIASSSDLCSVFTNFLFRKRNKDATSKSLRVFHIIPRYLLLFHQACEVS